MDMVPPAELCMISVWEVVGEDRGKGTYTPPMRKPLDGLAGSEEMFFDT